ncbi:efflux RND transporter periplasmic adaptor subunit [Leptothoe sp. PORK10 BA2]|uniref:efflux RND transporter periplasmic adaptor subunit n=1 Tax=Leptothoe sp. PORK10 BA2 TaxID=3110254 RepID=UPI002B20D331|nr:efflux RND transporter periplasmic adaptor subunit [Leptothoe sp. PORK10 BA2]MEA5462386.1 efflux RND transporter periplasmic adaptor subunit [Leptothoe sp. PORK10 BA2]
MKPTLFISCMLACGLAVSAPTVVFAHVGHGDEFQAEGGVQRVNVNPETDQILGIVVTPIETAADGGPVVMVPVTALVDADGKQLVFVQYENFYEPVSVKTGTTKGELIEITEGLSVGEKLVTQGSLSLFAESRKTQTAAVSPSPAEASPSPVEASPSPVVSPQGDEAHAQAHAQGTTHSHEGESGFPMTKYLVVVGVALAGMAGAIAFVGTRQKKSTFSDKDI